jgi:divalent metal cation (Fe/Co/Zn/Cd) transporter
MTRRRNENRHRFPVSRFEDLAMTAAIALFVFAVATVLASLTLAVGTVRAPGSGLFPLVLGLLLAVLSLAQGASVYRQHHRRAPATSGPAVAAERFSDGTRRVLLFMGAVAVAVALLPVIGYALASLLLMAALLRIFGVVRWPVIGVLSVATASMCWLVFVRILAIPLPAGLPGF